VGRVIGASAELLDGSTYLLPEGTVAYVKVTSGYPDIINLDVAKTTVLQIKEETGNVTIPLDTDGDYDIHNLSANIPAIISTDLKSDFNLQVAYTGIPASSDSADYWLWRVPIAGKSGAYGDVTVNFMVKYLNANGHVYRQSSNQITFRLTGAGSAEVPGKPKKISAKTDSGKSIMLQWNTPVEAQDTRIETRTDPDDSWALLATVQGSGKDLEYLHTGLTAETKHYYQLRCENGAGNSAYSDSVSCKTLNAAALPTAPVIGGIVSPDGASIVVSYTPSTEAKTNDGRRFPNTYRAYYRLTSDPDTSGSYSSREVDSSNTNVLISGLDSDTSYTVYMTAVNETGESAATAQIAVSTTPDPGLPPEPTNFTATTVDYVSQNVTWSVPVGDVLGFGLYYSTDQATWTPVVATGLPASSRSWTQAGLTPSTTYYWRIFTWNNYHGATTYSSQASTSAATDALPAAPGIPVLASVFSPNNHTAIVTMVPGSPSTQLSFNVYRSSTSGGTYTLVGNVASANPASFTDGGLDARANYFYIVKAVGWAGETAASNEVQVTTLAGSANIYPVSAFLLNADSKNRIKELGGRAFITSNLDRWVIRYGSSWYKAGLRPIRGTVSMAKGTGGVLEDGVYSVYLVLIRGTTRSIPSVPSATVTIDDSDRTLVITPPLNTANTKVECRDFGYDIYNDVIDGATGWEVYLAEQNQAKAYRVAVLPLAVADWEDTTGSKTYTINPTYDVQEIFGGTRRPMEVLGESSLPPSCWEAEVKDNRIFATGESDITLSDADVTAGATLSITTGNSYFTVTNWDATDACIYHVLVLSESNTGWEIYDYDFDAVATSKVTKCYIRHPDPAINVHGFDGAGGSFTDFYLKGNPNRVYASAYFSGEALGELTFSPETFPPLTIFETEFFPEDNGSPKCIVAAGGVLMVAKDEKWIVCEGGDEPDFPIIQTKAISRGSGLNAIFSVTRDANDVIYFLGDTGPFRVTASGVEKINIRFGNARLFTEVFDMSSVPNARGAWFSREDWCVWTGLDRIGNTGNKDGFVLDVKNGAVMPFDTPYELSHLKEYKSTGGDFQLLFGADQGRMGYFMKKGLYVDDVDYTQTYPFNSSTAIIQRLITGVLDTERALSMRWAQMRVKTMPGDASFSMTLSVDGKTRCSDPTDFNADDFVEFNTGDDSDHVSFGPGRYEQAQFELVSQTLTSAPNAYFEIRELPVRAVIRHAS
jgi:hypothetical protein